MDLRSLFLGQQGQMIATLEAERAMIGHSRTKGAASELQWLAMLRKYLPERYCADSAFILDSDGQISEQIDVVIYDRHYSPFLFREEGVTYIPAESVYAVFEVKQVLKRRTLEYAGGKAASVRRLQRTSVAIAHAGGSFPPKEPPRILAGFLALDRQRNSLLGERFRDRLAALDADSRLDLGCVLRHGGFAVEYPPDAPPVVQTSQPDTALIFFFVKLLERLQAMGTVPAVDFGKYGRVL